MTLTLFNSAVERFDFLEQNTEYLFSKGHIKKVYEKSENAQKHPYQINMDDKGGMIEILDGDQVTKAVKIGGRQ